MVAFINGFTYEYSILFSDVLNPLVNLYESKVDFKKTKTFELDHK